MDYIAVEGHIAKNVWSLVCVFEEDDTKLHELGEGRWNAEAEGRKREGRKEFCYLVTGQDHAHMPHPHLSSSQTLGAIFSFLNKVGGGGGALPQG